MKAPIRLTIPQAEDPMMLIKVVDLLRATLNAHQEILGRLVFVDPPFAALVPPNYRVQDTPILLYRLRRLLGPTNVRTKRK